MDVALYQKISKQSFHRRRPWTKHVETIVASESSFVWKPFCVLNKLCTQFNKKFNQALSLSESMHNNVSS